MAWLCIDAGTSVIKSVVFEDDGRELALARTSVPVLRPEEGFAEQDMEDVWRAVLATSHQAVAQAGVPIAGVATTAQGDGVWLVDSKGQPLRKAVLWNDGRAASIVEQWRVAGILEQGAQISGSTAYPGVANSIWRWFALHEPEVLQTADASLTCNGWLFLRLTGELAADLSDGSNPFCDVRERRYSQALFDLYGVAEWQHLLPVLRADGDPMGTLLPEAAAAMGIRGRVPVVMAPYDIVTTAHGAGCLAPGQGCVILGTTICAEVLSDVFEMEGAGTTIALDGDRFLHAMPTLTGCEALSQAAELLRLSSIEELEGLAETAEPGAGGLVFLPYLSPAGERSPFLHPHARGGWSGLSLLHTSETMARSVYEGLSYVVRDCLRAAGVEPGASLRVCGGGARSAFWCQMIADVTGHEVLRPRAEELGARGALLHGRVRAGDSATLQQAFLEAPVQEDTFLPQSFRRAAYEAGYARFGAARRSAELLWNSSHGDAV